MLSDTSRAVRIRPEPEPDIRTCRSLESREALTDDTEIDLRIDSAPQPQTLYAHAICHRHLKSRKVVLMESP